MLPLLIVAVGAMLFFGTRKQRKQMQEQQQLQNSLQPGDQVMTTSGLFGTIAETHEDRIDIEIAPGVVTSWLRAAVREKVNPVVEDDTDADDEPTAAVAGEPASTAEVAPPLEQQDKATR
nr:preprotein translocase subunit YajC [Kutzneria albida]